MRAQDDVSADDVAAGTAARSRRANTGTRVCVVPAGNGVTLTTMVGTQKALEETLIADGSNQAITDRECRGSKRSEWSQSAHRIYSTAEISCDGQAPRKISSLSMMTPGPTWVDIQLIDIQGRKNIRVRRLQRVDDPSARRPAATSFTGESSWTVDDIKEASSKLAPEAVQAALVELRSGFELKSKQLLELHKAGVSQSIIDLMVALSYPKRFVIERPVNTAPPLSGFGYGGFGLYDDAMWPFYMDTMFWPSYYSPFAYRYWGLYDPYYYPGSGYVVLPPVGEAPSAPVPSGQGRVVDGRGYTRVTTRTPEPVRVTNGGNGSNGTMSSGESSSGSGGNSGVSSGGYSSGGNSGDGGRTAVPRPPGGN
jgi:hypothetical protein